MRTSVFEGVRPGELVEGDFEMHFAPEEDVYVQVLTEEDNVWQPREGAGFVGLVTPGQALDADYRPCAGIQVLPYHEIPRGAKYASGAPGSITGTDFQDTLSSGEKVHWKFAVRHATSEEVEAAKLEANRSTK